jgi:hypothetical protein
MIINVTSMERVVPDLIHLDPWRAAVSLGGENIREFRFELQQGILSGINGNAPVSIGNYSCEYHPCQRHDPYGGV